MLSLVAVFKDILPGFRIRLPTEKELGMPVSKDVKKVRDYEAALLRAYQAFLKALLDAARGQRGLGFARAAIRCLCMLLPSLYSFNYSSDLLQVGASSEQASFSTGVVAESCWARMQSHELCSGPFVST